MGNYRYESLAIAPERELESILRGGAPPDPEEMAGYEFRGWNTPFFARFAGIQKFKKGFFHDHKAGGRIRGYNKDIRQEGGLAGPWLEKGVGGRARPFGFFDLEPPEQGWYPNSVLFNYACSRNGALNPTRVLRDYVVQPDADNPDLLLGKAYLDLKVGRPSVSWFILERLGRSTPPEA